MYEIQLTLFGDWLNWEPREKGADIPEAWEMRAVAVRRKSNGEIIYDLTFS